jgi:hypothetical protein
VELRRQVAITYCLPSPRNDTPKVPSDMISGFARSSASSQVRRRLLAALMVMAVITRVTGDGGS